MAETHDDTPCVLDAIETAASPQEAIAAAANRLSFRQVVEPPLSLGRNVLKIIINGDAREAVRSAAHIR